MVLAQIIWVNSYDLDLLLCLKMPKQKAVATTNKEEAPKPAKKVKKFINEKAEELYHECIKWRLA